jgi:epoxyqueuosine reductase
MRELELTKTLHERSKEQGYKIKIVPIAHVKELKKEIEAHHHKGLLDEELYDEYLASFDFECQQKLPAAKSLVIGSIPQPQVRVVFKWEKDAYPVVIPPAYNSSTNMHLADLLKAFLGAAGYQLKTVRLPEKLLAVRSGMARYGKNNITYIEGMGSFHSPVVFISDFPCRQDAWIEPRILEHCETCSACMKACPTDAIGSDRFLLHAERCITFHNERSKDFAKWLSPAWHNCLWAV